MPWRHVTSTTDGAEVLWDFAQRSGEGSPDDRVVKHLIVPRSGQYVFKDIVQHYLQQIRFEEDKYARMIGLPQFGGANVVLDPSITGHNGLLALSESAWWWTGIIPDRNPDVAGPHSADGFQDPNGGRGRVGHRAFPQF